MEGFSRTYGACNEDSLYHDIQCRHRVKTARFEGCGSNCAGGGDQPPFVCLVCVTDKVRMDLSLAGLSLGANSGAADRESMAEKIAHQEMQQLVLKHHRLTTAVPKLEPELQFFSEIPGALDDGGFLQEPAQHERKFKRPGKSPHSAQVPKQDPAKRGVADRQKGSHALTSGPTAGEGGVGDQDDLASVAVCRALEHLWLV